MRLNHSIRLIIVLIALLGFWEGVAQSKTVRVLQHNGDPIEGAGMRRYTTGWGAEVQTDSNGEVSYTGTGVSKFRISYNNTYFETASMSMDGGVVTVYTTLVTVEGYEDDGTPLAGVSSTFYEGGHRVFGTTDGSGGVSKEIFPSTYSFTFKFNNTENIKSIDIDRDAYTADEKFTIETYLSRVTFEATSYQSVKVSGVAVSYYKGGWRNFLSTDINGKTTALMYPGEYTQFKATKNGTSTSEFTITVPGNSLEPETPQLKNITIPIHPERVKFYNHETPSQNVAVQYYSGSYFNITGDNFYMFPGEYTLMFRSGIRRKVLIPSSANYNFEKVVSIIRLKDHSGNPYDIESIRGGFGSNINYHVNTSTNLPTPISEESNSVWIDLSSVNASLSRTMEVKKNSSTFTITKDVYDNNVFEFQTSLMTLRLQNCDGTGIENGSIRYGMSTLNTHWGVLTDANGETSKDLFPGSFVIEMSVNQTKEERTVTFRGSIPESV